MKVSLGNYALKQIITQPDRCDADKLKRLVDIEWYIIDLQLSNIYDDENLIESIYKLVADSFDSNNIYETSDCFERFMMKYNELVVSINDLAINLDKSKHEYKYALNKQLMTINNALDRYSLARHCFLATYNDKRAYTRALKNIFDRNLRMNVCADGRVRPSLDGFEQY